MTYLSSTKTVDGSNNFIINLALSDAVVGRQGGLPFIAQPTFTIPADTSQVAVTLLNSDGGAVAPCHQLVSENWDINPCYINGVQGTLSYSSGTYYFARTTAGTVTTINRPTPIITDAMKNYRSNPCIIWMGQNGGYDDNNDKLISEYKLMIDYLDSVKKKYIIIGLNTNHRRYKCYSRRAMSTTIISIWYAWNRCILYYYS